MHPDSVGIVAAVGILVVFEQPSGTLHCVFQVQAVDKGVARRIIAVTELPDPEIVDDIEQTQVGVDTEPPFMGLLVDRPGSGIDGILRPFEGMVGKSQLGLPLRAIRQYPRFTWTGNNGNL